MTLPNPADIERGCQSIAVLMEDQSDRNVDSTWRILHLQLLDLINALRLGSIRPEDVEALIHQVDEWSGATFRCKCAFTLLIKPQSAQNEHITSSESPQYSVNQQNQWVTGTQNNANTINNYYGTTGANEPITPPFMVESLPDIFIRRDKKHLVAI